MKEDLDPQGSEHKGFGGLFERALRRFKSLVHILTMIPIYVAGSLIVGLALTPGVFLYSSLSQLTEGLPGVVHYPVLGFSFGAGYFLYGFSLLAIVPCANFLLRGYLKPWRGPYYSLSAVRWYVHNGLTYLVRYTFLEFVTPTPFNLMFYRFMGMKIGKGSQINSTAISDPSLIQLGKKVTIGGSATVVAHYGMGGYLVIAPVMIEDGVTVGLRATVMGGVTIGKGAKVLPESVVLPKTVIPPGETWGGIPARRIDVKKVAA